MDYQEEEQPRHVAEYYFVLVKHKWMIGAVLVLTLALVYLYNSRQKPVYRATATMVIESERRRSPISGQIMNYESFYFGSLAFNTHCRLITSRPVLERVIKDLGMDQESAPEKLEAGPLQGLLSRLKKNLFILLRKKEKPPLASEKKPGIRAALTGRIHIKPVKDTRLLKINVEDTDPRKAQRTANSLATAYIAFNIENHMKSSKNTLTWMTDQLYDMKVKLEDAEEKFLAFKQQEKLFSITGKQSMIAQKIQDFNDTYLKTRNRRMEIDARLAQLKREVRSAKDIFYVRSLIQNALIDSLYNQMLDLEMERSRLSKIFKPKHPKMVQIQANIENTRKKLKEEITKEIDNLRSERAVLRARERVLQKTIGDFEKEALETNRKELKYRILERNVETYRKLYDTLLAKVKESNIVDTIDVSNIRIAEEASLPNIPVKPNKKRNMMMGVIFGLLIGVGLAFFREYLDRSIRTEEDVQRYFGLPVLAVIPATEGKKMAAHKNGSPHPE